MAKATKADALIIRKDGTKHTLIPAFSITTWSTHHELSGKIGIGIVIDLDDGGGHECLRIVDLTIKQARCLAQDIIEMADKLDTPSQAEEPLTADEIRSEVESDSEAYWHEIQRHGV